MCDEEGVAAVVIGSTASVLFVVSHVPQVWDLWHRRNMPSPSMFCIQFVSGVLWIAYGTLENATTILVFGSLSTFFRVVILGLILASPSSRDARSDAA